MVEQRIAVIATMMREGRWSRGETADVLAVEWELSPSTVRDYSAEAWRRVCAAADDATTMRPTIAGTLAVALAQSAEARDHSSTAKLGDTLSRVIGARAPERHEVAVVIAKYESWPKGERVKWLRERAEELRAEADRLEALDAEP